MKKFYLGLFRNIEKSPKKPYSYGHISLRIYATNACGGLNNTLSGAKKFTEIGFDLAKISRNVTFCNVAHGPFKGVLTAIFFCSKQHITKSTRGVLQFTTITCTYALTPP